jgi:hypothetical protein
MEMNSLEGVSYVTSKFWLADFVKTGLIWDRACLMEFSKQSIEINNRSGVGHELMPV